MIGLLFRPNLSSDQLEKPGIDLDQCQGQGREMGRRLRASSSPSSASPARARRPASISGCRSPALRRRDRWPPLLSCHRRYPAPRRCRAADLVAPRRLARCRRQTLQADPPHRAGGDDRRRFHSRRPDLRGLGDLAGVRPRPVDGVDAAGDSRDLCLAARRPEAASSGAPIIRGNPMDNSGTANTAIGALHIVCAHCDT